MKREAGASLKNFIFDYSGTAPATVIELTVESQPLHDKCGKASTGAPRPLISPETGQSTRLGVAEGDGGGLIQHIFLVFGSPISISSEHTNN